jgi:hypothetical protein
LYADLLRDEAEYLHSLEQQDVDSMVAAYLEGCAISGGGPDAGVACPICQEVDLAQHRGVILCPRQHLRLDVAEEKMSLGGLRSRLAGVLEAHSAAGCLARPRFEQRGGFGVATLLMTCQTCGAMDVVV